MSPPSRGAWIEIVVICSVLLNGPSPPSRGAWIEILLLLQYTTILWVAPLAGGVD